jgi:predicted DCC family thiol-disulfide oxidoreductase YuxK
MASDSSATPRLIAAFPADPHLYEMSSTTVAQTGRPILVFDGGCTLCNGTVRRVLRHEQDHDIVFAATQSESGAELLRRSGFNPSDPQTFLFIENDRVLTRSDAAIALASRLKSPWRWLKWLRFIPRRLRDTGYDWIARRRLKFFGHTGVCLRLEGEHADRFLP